jgi:hypothetical protein
MFLKRSGKWSASCENWWNSSRRTAGSSFSRKLYGMSLAARYVRSKISGGQIMARPKMKQPQTIMVLCCTMGGGTYGIVQSLVVIRVLVSSSSPVVLLLLLLRLLWTSVVWSAAEEWTRHPHHHRQNRPRPRVA